MLMIKISINYLNQINKNKFILVKAIGLGQRSRFLMGGKN